jgi:hypothetical protein
LILHHLDLTTTTVDQLLSLCRERKLLIVMEPSKVSELDRRFFTYILPPEISSLPGWKTFQNVTLGESPRNIYPNEHTHTASLR